MAHSRLIPVPFELHELLGFVAVVEADSVTEAADRLRIAQPALSRKVCRLERGLGVKLFAREHSRMRLTPQGQWFLLHARYVLALCEQLSVATAALPQ